MISGLHDGRIKALYLIGENPAQTEPNAHHVEEGLAGLEFLLSQDIFLNDSTRKYAHVVLPASSFAEKDGTFTNTERRISRVRAAAPLPGRRRSTARSSASWRRRSAPVGPSTRMPSRSGTSSPTSRPTGTGSATTASRRTACSGRAPIASIPARRTCTRRSRPARPAAASSSPVEYQPPIEEPDSEYPYVLIDRPHALPLQLGEHDDARAGHTEKQEQPF